MQADKAMPVRSFEEPGENLASFPEQSPGKLLAHDHRAVAARCRLRKFCQRHPPRRKIRSGMVAFGHHGRAFRAEHFVRPARGQNAPAVDQNVFDVHLMCSKPEILLEPFAKAGADQITIHVELGNAVTPLLWKIRSLGKKSGFRSIRPPASNRCSRIWKKLITC
jgi:hypothetical protein